MAVEPGPHWEQVYEQRGPDEVSWYEPLPQRSLALIGSAQLLVADQDEPAPALCELGVAVWTSGVQAPLEDVPLDHDGARHYAVRITLAL